MAAALGCFLMAWMTNFPIALAPGMGTNSYFAFVICLGMGLPWQSALSLTFWNGVVFFLLSVTGLRRRIAESLPNGLKVGIQVGIGFFIAFIGLKNVGSALPVILTLLVLDLFDSIGTLVGLARRAKLMDEKGKMPKMGQALTADSIATMGGALLGTSTTTSYIESSAGIESGGKTGLTAVITGVCFLLALIFTPILTAIPKEATAPALIMVGVFMAQGLKELDFGDLSEVTPAFLTMLMIPLTFSITEGIGIGLVAFVAIMLLQGRFREVPLFSYLVAVLFLVYYGLR